MDFDNFYISKREVIFSIAIICVMLVIGLIIHGNINENLILDYQEYNIALQINENPELFAYGMKTNVGNAFVYGELYAIDPVSYPEVEGEYSYIKKVKERYTRHTRTVTRTRTVNGKTKTYTDTEVYYTWDAIDSWSQHSTRINFVGNEFDYGMIQFPNESHIDTQKESSKIRYVYYGSPTYCVGTLYANLKDKTINNQSFYIGKTISETLEHLESEWQLIVFWIFWILLTCVSVFGFYYLDNRWLEDKKKYKYTSTW